MTASAPCTGGSVGAMGHEDTTPTTVTDSPEDTSADTSTVFTVDQIRRAEEPLLHDQVRPDELMQSAASAVAAAARLIMRQCPPVKDAARVLLAVGSGGNGGDALYAGRDLLAGGHQVDAVLLGRDRHTGDVRVHDRALEAFTEAGGHVIGYADLWTRRPCPYRLLIDGVLGTGGSGGVDPRTATVLDFAGRRLIPLLSVDVPSGTDADTGADPGPVEVTDPLDGHTDRVPAHAVADVTVTFGGWRRVHAVNPHCGQVLLADPSLDSGRSIGGELQKLDAWWSGKPGVHIGFAAVEPTPDRRGPTPATGVGGYLDTHGDTRGDTHGHTHGNGHTSPLLSPGLKATGLSGPTEPGPDDDKYTGGVVGICAGSDRYPGAAVLATTGAVRATSAMVRYVGTGAAEVLRATPEVIVSPTVEETGRVQAWVVGPGRGTGDEAAAELAELLGRQEPVLVDADALTLLAAHPDLREALIARSPGDYFRGGTDRQTLLTPHAGEFRRLAAAVNRSLPRGVEPVPDPSEGRIVAAVALSRVMHCSLLLKGRNTVVVDRAVPASTGAAPCIRVTCVDAGTSWGATPGSGDVLSGITGALMAASAAQLPGEVFSAGEAAALHASAAAVAAETTEGYAPTSASKIADAVPRAWARSGPPSRSRRRVR